MARKPQAPGKNTAAKMISLINEDQNIPIPLNVKLTAQEAELWPQFTCTRSKEDWSEFDLILLSKVVKLELQIRLNWETHLNEGVIVENVKGTIIQNPRLLVIESYTRQQMALIRSLSMTAKGDTNISSNARKAKQVKNILDDQPLIAN